MDNDDIYGKNWMRYGWMIEGHPDSVPNLPPLSRWVRFKLRVRRLWQRITGESK